MFCISYSFVEVLYCLFGVRVSGTFHLMYVNVLRGTRNLSFVLRMSLLRTFETIWILVITLECSNITASKSIRRERKM